MLTDCSNQMTIRNYNNTLPHRTELNNALGIPQYNDTNRNDEPTQTTTHVETSCIAN